MVVIKSRFKMSIKSIIMNGFLLKMLSSSFVEITLCIYTKTINHSSISVAEYLPAEYQFGK